MYLFLYQQFTDSNEKLQCKGVVHIANFNFHKYFSSLYYNCAIFIMALL